MKKKKKSKKNKKIKSGIYKIQNFINGKTYIGSSKKVKERFNEHKCTLRKGIHRSKKLQDDWNKFSENAFVFEMIEEIPDSNNLKEMEKYYIALYDSYENGYNSNRGGSGIMKGQMSLETKEKISRALKGREVSEETRIKISNGNMGKRVTDEGRRHLSEAKSGSKNPRSAFSVEEVITIRNMYLQGFTQTEIAIKYGVTSTAICNIVNRKRYKNIS